MKQHYPFVICLFIFSTLSLPSVALLGQNAPPFLKRNQTSCSDLLNQAKDDFNRGKIWDLQSPEFLDCLQGAGADGFSKLEKIQAYRLLTLMAIFQENTPEAQKNIQKLLVLDPEFRLSPFDPPEFRNLYARFKVRPLYALRIQAGPNASLLRVGEVYGLDNTQDAIGIFNPNGTRKLKLGAQMTLAADFFLPNPHWESSVEISYVQNRYEYDHRQRFLSAGAVQFSNLNFTEIQNWGSTSVLMRYNFLRKKDSLDNARQSFPYVFLGGSYQYLLHSEIDNIVRSTFDNNDEEDASPVSGLAKRKLNDIRQGQNFALTGGIGWNLKIRRHYFFVETRAVLGLTNIVNAKNRYANEDLVYAYGYIDPDLFLNLAMIQVGYRYLFYQIKKTESP